MDKSMFEKYINEMRAMKAMATATPLAQMPTQVESQPNDTDMAGEGKLIVSVTSVRGIYPIPGAKVTVFTGDRDNMTVISEVYTDQSGKTPEILLPAPSVIYTESPEPEQRPYSYYNIHTLADGFVENINYNVSVFDGTTSLQSVNLFPLTSQVESNRPIVIDEFENYTL